MSLKLPFLEDSLWPISKEPEERVVNSSPDAKLQNHLIDQLLIAIEHKDIAGMREAFLSLVHSILSEDHDMGAN